MRRSIVAVLIISAALVAGCTTSATIKDASTKHAANLLALQQGITEYRKKVDDYFDRLIQQQREAHIANHLYQQIHRTAEDQAASIAIQMQQKPNSQEPATDFIAAGEAITDAFEFWGRNFDRWVENTEGKNLADRREALKKKASEIEGNGDRTTATKLREEANRSDDDLTFISVAIDLKQQRDNLMAQLKLLAAQVTTMQAFHSKIDEFLASDATIDGAKIAAAAAAGSKADIAGVLGKK